MSGKGTELKPGEDAVQGMESESRREFLSRFRDLLLPVLTTAGGIAIKDRVLQEQLEKARQELAGSEASLENLNDLFVGIQESLVKIENTVGSNFDSTHSLLDTCIDLVMFFKQGDLKSAGAKLDALHSQQNVLLEIVKNMGTDVGEIKERLDRIMERLKEEGSFSSEQLKALRQIIEPLIEQIAADKAINEAQSGEIAGLRAMVEADHQENTAQSTEIKSLHEKIDALTELVEKLKPKD